MKGADDTQMGGNRRSFGTTDWTQLTSFERVHSRYWKPVYCYFRRRGKRSEDAKDLAQEFFMEVLLEGGWLDQVDRAKGSFRVYMLTRLDWYLKAEHRKKKAKKRSPKGRLISLDGLEDFDVPDRARHLSPDEVLIYAMALEVLHEAIADVEAECRDDGLLTHWEIFYQREVRPHWDGAEAPSLGEMCERLDVPDAGKASNMIITVKRKFRRALERRLRAYVSSEDQVQEELNDLIQILGKARAG